MAKAPAVEATERTVGVSNPRRVYFPATGRQARPHRLPPPGGGAGDVNALREPPRMLHRFPTGVSSEKRTTEGAGRGRAVAGDRERLVSRYGQHAAEPSTRDEYAGAAPR